MIDEHQGQCIYENGRFRLREETDYAIIDELEDFPPIMVQTEETDDGSESQYADRRGVLHLMNQLADTNPNEQRHFYLKYRLDKVHNDNDLLRKENEQLKETINEVKTDEKQLSISFMDYKMQLIEVLQQNYNYAYSQRQKNLDKSIVAKTYEVLAQTVCHIAETMNVDIERFPRDGDVE